MAELKITGQNFDREVLHSEKPVLLDFWAEWCGPCRMVAPTVAEIAEERSGSLVVGKVNVDEEMELAMRYGINSIPSLLLFKNGKLAGTTIGYQSKEQLLAFIDGTGA